MVLYGLIAADIIMALAFLLNFSHLPPQVPLFYSRPWGEDQLVDTWLIIIVPIILHIFVFFNYYLYQKLFLPSYFVKRVLDGMNWFLIVSLATIVVRLLFFIS